MALDWWPVTRDSVAYSITVMLLILVLRDGRVEWYEALLLVSVYLLYLLGEWQRSVPATTASGLTWPTWST